MDSADDPRLVERRDAHNCDVHGPSPLPTDEDRDREEIASILHADECPEDLDEDECHWTGFHPAPKSHESHRMIIATVPPNWMLAVPDDCTEDWIEHHEDGSHTHHMFAAWVSDALDHEPAEQ